MVTIQMTDSPYEAVVKGLVLALTAPNEDKASDVVAMVSQLANTHLTPQQLEDAKREALQQTSFYDVPTGEEG